MIRPWVANAVILIASTVWVCNFIADIVVKDYVANEAINGMFALLIGGVIALRSKGGNGKGSDDK